MTKLISCVLALCLCLCASFALAQGDPGPGDPGDGPEGQSGLYVYFPGMIKADAQKAGAVPGKDGEMTGKVDWGGAQWDAHMVFEGDEITVVGLKAKLNNDLVFPMLKEMEEVLCEPMMITRTVHGEKTETDPVQLAVQGKDKDARNDVLLTELNTFAGQEKGEIKVIFCPTDMLEEMAGEIKANGDLDEKDVMKNFGDSLIYSLQMNKQDDSITVISSPLAALNNM